MLELNGLTVETDMLTLLQDLKIDLNAKGIELLHTIKPVNDNIMISCPAHKGGQERKPSCGVLAKPMHNQPAGTVHCFTCGYTADLTSFISYCFGIGDGGLYGNNWIKQKYNTTIQQNRNFSLSLDRTPTHTEYVTIPDHILDQYAYTHDYVKHRGISDEVIELFDIGYDPENNCITFPVKDLRGNVKFIQTRQIEYKMYNIPSGIKKTDFLFGGYEVIQGKYKEVWIVESIFNALTCWTYGIPAVALLGTGGGNQYRLLEQLPVRTYVLALDNDVAGREGSKKIKTYVRYKFFKQVLYTDGRDINELGALVKNLEIKNL